MVPFQVSTTFSSTERYWSCILSAFGFSIIFRTLPEKIASELFLASPTSLDKEPSGMMHEHAKARSTPSIVENAIKTKQNVVFLIIELGMRTGPSKDATKETSVFLKPTAKKALRSNS